MSVREDRECVYISSGRSAVEYNKRGECEWVRRVGAVGNNVRIRMSAHTGKSNRLHSILH